MKIEPLARTQSDAVPYPPLSEEVRAVLPTDCAAFHLNRRPQTLREWACLDTGPLRPVRIMNRLGWPTADIRRLVSGGAV